jgi:cytochrome c-type biogenesis protein CcmE
MAESTWEKSPELAQRLKPAATQRWMYMGAGIVLIGVVALLIFKGTIFGSSYFKTVAELTTDASYIDKKVQVSGVVVQNVDGENDVRFDSETNTLYFTIAHIPSESDEIRDAGGLGDVLASAVADPDLPRLQIVYENNEIPDLLYNDHPTQAIITGRLGEDGIFYATLVQTKCPTKYADDVPDQVANN